MERIFIAPRKYVQGRGIIEKLGEYLQPICNKPVILWDPFIKNILGDKIEASLKVLDCSFVDFNGESTKEEAMRVAQIVKEQGADLVVGIGGGKTLDTAKGAGAAADTGFASIPTVASNDSPTSSFTVWYDAEGNCQGFESWGRNPELVLVDSQVIVNAPVRAFLSGMGDALATWIEARVCAESHGPNLAGGTSTMAAQAIARLGFDILMEHGEQALRAVERNVVTPSVEKVIEANILLSGLGFESGGCATAHMVANCLPSFEECHGMTHGEEVGFGIVVQLCLEGNRNMAEVYSIVDFMIRIGLPVTLKDLGLENVSRERLQSIADICVAEGSLCHNHTFRVSENAIIDVIYAADALGTARKAVNAT